MKLYTRGGDKGMTSLYGGARVSKANTRVAAYGEVDELNSAIGVARATQPWTELDALLATIQSELFDLGCNLAADQKATAAKLPAIPGADAVTRMERAIDSATSKAPPLANFILPSGTPLAAWLLYTRCVCRRAERMVVLLGESEPVNEAIVVYLNRLSDLLFALGREANARAGVAETPWKG